MKKQKKTTIKKINSLKELSGTEQDLINNGLNCLFEIKFKNDKKAKYLLGGIFPSILDENGKFLYIKDCTQDIKILYRILFLDIPCHIEEKTT
jgi:hypothetical protein